MKNSNANGKKPKKLPRNIQNFTKIIFEDRLYADKTSYIYKILTECDSKYLFLFRPRGFGKTLLLDTFNELFQGPKELFENLWITRETDYDFKPYPVLRLSLNFAETYSPEALKNYFTQTLLAAAESMKVKLETSAADLGYGFILQDLLAGLYKKGAGTAVLIDDYDAPVSSHFDNSELAEANCQVLHDFLTVLKGCEVFIRFVLVTGLTGFALKNDSGPDNFSDISLSPDFGGVCGFTVSEFDRLFGGRMDELLEVQKENGSPAPNSRTSSLRKQILDWYGGYNWLGPEQILNPFAIVKLFSRKKFGRYWIQKDPPARLKELIRSRPLDFLGPQTASCRSSKIGKIDLKRLDPGLVLFHSGYLAIDKEISPPLTLGTGPRCTFKFPNKEAEEGYSSLITDTLGKRNFSVLKPWTANFLKAAELQDSAVIDLLCTSLLSGVTPLPFKADEYFYHTHLQRFLAFGGAKVQAEWSGVPGRTDIIVEGPGKRYLIIAVRYRKSEAHHTEADIEQILAEASEETLKQLAEKDYCGPFSPPARKILGMSLVFYGRDNVQSGFVSAGLLKPGPAG
ncbi:MAG: AAA family ATPase [Deltaproteobacteria bacterium]|jgi:hypothetical protein|nr:AAA family ATPase [Deltaproteobacteria bacterium]